MKITKTQIAIFAVVAASFVVSAVLYNRLPEQIASHWNAKRVVAETTKDNQAMISVFKKLGFQVTYNQDNTVSVFKEMETDKS